MSRASYFGPIFGLSTAYDWAALVALRMPRGTGLALRITTTIAIMDQASQALAEVFSAGESAPYRTNSEKSSVPRSTLHRRKHGGPSIELKAQS